MWIHFSTAMVALAVALLISIQQDPEGGMLTEGFKGLHLAMLIALALAVWHIFCMMRIMVYGEEFFE